VDRKTAREQSSAWIRAREDVSKGFEQGGDASRGTGLSSLWKIIDRKEWQIDHGDGSDAGRVSG